MNFSAAEQMKLPGIISITFHGDFLNVKLNDGRILSVPIAWFPRLAKAKKSQLKNYQISPSGYGINWPELDEDLSVLGFLWPGIKLIV